MINQEMTNINYLCPSCGYDLGEEMYRLPEHDGNEAIICPSCHYQPGYTDLDQGYSFKGWRRKWVDEGMPWDRNLSNSPVGWDPKVQLSNIGVVVDENGKIIKDIEDPDWHWVPSEEERQGNK